MIKNYVNALKIFKTNCQPSIYTKTLIFLKYYLLPSCNTLVQLKNVKCHFKKENIKLLCKSTASTLSVYSAFYEFI